MGTVPVSAARCRPPVGHRFAAALLLLVTITGCSESQQPPALGQVDAVRLAAAAKEPHNWFTSGRDQDGTWFSPLATINTTNVVRLGFAWQYQLGTKRGLAVWRGRVYVGALDGWLHAIDATTGRRL